VNGDDTIDSWRSTQAAPDETLHPAAGYASATNNHGEANGGLGAQRQLHGWSTPTPGEAVRLYGRNAALQLVREFLTREQGNGMLHSRRYPVLVFTGMRGTGKTALLADLAGRLDQQVAFARIDCEGFDGDARDLLSLIAFDLNRQSGRYGSLPFPRLITGQIAITAFLNTTDRGAAREQIHQVLEANQRTAKVLKDAFTEMLKSGFEALGGTHGVTGTGLAIETLASRYGPEVILGGLAASRRGRRLLLGKGQDWYGHQDRDLGRNPLDVLVDLNRMAALPDAEGNRREVAELLWAAFLADLRDSFAHSRHASSWTLNCAVLLDNVDTQVGHAFLDELIMARRQRAAYAADDPDPLTVVATSRGDLAERVRVRGESAVTLTSASYSDYQRRMQTQVSRQSQVGLWWYPVLLPDLTLDEVGNMVSALELPGGTRRSVTSAVHRFTAGHPGATRMMLEAIAEHPDKPLELLGILTGPEPGVLSPGGRTLEEGLLHRLTEGIPPEAMADLITCAAAHQKEPALRLAADSGLLTGMRGEESVIFAASLWRTGPPDQAAQLHTVLWRLLLRRLARRGVGTAADWASVFGWLRASCQDAGDKPGELYYALAVGTVEYVSRWFVHALEHSDPAEWVRVLRHVSAAPNRLDHRQPPGSQLRSLTRWAVGKEQPLELAGRLVAAAWICADPLSAAYRRSLLREMAADLNQIASYSRDMTVLRDEADRYRDAAEDDGGSYD
jgi:hypothetical protein